MPKKDEKTKKDIIVEAALKAAEFQGWSSLTLRDIADEADISIFELREHVDDKFDVLCVLGKAIDKKTLKNYGDVDPELSVKDALFEILMERFDVLNEYRPGLIAILEDLKFDPKTALMSLPFLSRSMAWMLEAVQVKTSGVKGAIALTALSALYLKVVHVWMRDESEDMAQTMAALDKELARAEQAANSLGF